MSHDPILHPYGCRCRLCEQWHREARRWWIGVAIVCAVLIFGPMLAGIIWGQP